MLSIATGVKEIPALVLWKSRLTFIEIIILIPPLNIASFSGVHSLEHSKVESCENNLARIVKPSVICIFRNIRSFSITSTVGFTKAGSSNWWSFTTRNSFQNLRCKTLCKDEPGSRNGSNIWNRKLEDRKTWKKSQVQNNLCFNLTTMTSKFRLKVSQLSLQCFPSSLLNLLSSNQKQKFSFPGNFLTWPWKFHILSLGLKLKGNGLTKVSIFFRATVCKNLSELWNQS